MIQKTSNWKENKTKSIIIPLERTSIWT